MKQMTFEAATMQLALKQVREQLGDDVSILGTSRSESGVQVVVGIDEPDTTDSAASVETAPASAFAQSLKDARQPRAERRPEQPARWQAPAEPARRPAAEALARQSSQRGAVESKGQSPAQPRPAQSGLAQSGAQAQMLRDMQQQISRLTEWMQLGSSRPQQTHPLAASLRSMGFSEDFTSQLVEQTLLASQAASTPSIAALSTDLASRLPVAPLHIENASGVFIFVGASGTGKTTSIAKLAALLARAGRADEVGILSVDRYRVGSTEQIRAYGRLMKIAVDVVRPEETLTTALQRFSGKRLVLIDTAGLSPADPNSKAQFDELRQLEASSDHVSTILAVSATQHSRLVRSSRHYYAQLRPAAMLITKVDEAVELGGVLEMAIQDNLPIAYYADGQSIINHLHTASGQKLMQQALKLMHEQSESTYHVVQNIV